MEIILAVIILGIVFYILWKQGQKDLIKYENWKTEAQKIALQTPNFNVSDEVAPQLSFNADNWYIAIDENSKSLIFINKIFEKKIIHFNEIVDSEIIMDGSTYYKSSTSGTAVRGLVGGLLLGGVGAIIGGTTGKKSAVEKVERIDIKLTLDSLSSPVLKLCFWNLETKKTSDFYKSATEVVEKWAGIFDVIIRRNTSK
jgi:hypothetical protein